MGHSVRVVCPAGNLAPALRAAGCAVLEIKAAWPNLRRPWRGLFSYLRIARFARGVDVVHCNEHNMYPVGAIVARVLGRPTVCHVRFDLEPAFCNWLFRRYGSPGVLLWTSADQMQRCMPIVGERVPLAHQKLLRLGLDLKNFGNRFPSREEFRAAYNIEPGEFVIGTASAYKPIKRLEDFVDLVAQIRRSHPQVVGMIAGGSHQDMKITLISSRSASNCTKLPIGSN